MPSGRVASPRTMAEPQAQHSNPHPSQERRLHIGHVPRPQEWAVGIPRGHATRPTFIRCKWDEITDLERPETFSIEGSDAPSFHTIRHRRASVSVT